MAERSAAARVADALSPPVALHACNATATDPRAGGAIGGCTTTRPELPRRVDGLGASTGAGGAALGALVALDD